MSTELYDAKDIVDDIFHIAKVPPEKNDDHFYNTAMMQIGTLVKAMDEAGFAMPEQRRRVGEKKDELIGELIRLRDLGVLKTDEPRRMVAAPRIHMKDIRKL